MSETGLTRRRLLKTAAYVAGALALPFVHGVHAAGKLSAFFCLGSSGAERAASDAQIVR